MTMIERLVQEFEKEFETTESADETTTEQATTESEMDNVETDVQETGTQTTVSLVASIVEQLEREMMTTDDVPADDESESEQDVSADDQEPSEDDQDEQDDEADEEESEPADDEPLETDDGEQETDDEQDETNSQLDEIVKALEDERKKLEDERQEWQKKIEEAEQRASESERKARQLTMSFLLQSRDDVTDIRLVASLIGDVNKIEMGEGETLEEAISRKINETVKRYPSLAKDGKKEYRTITTNEGISVQSEVKPIGRATAKAQDEPFSSKQELLEEARQRAEKGGQKERVAYLALKRKYGIK